MLEENLTNQKVGENILNFEKELEQTKSGIRTNSGFLSADISNNLGNNIALVIMILVFGGLTLLIIYFLIFPTH